MWVLAGVVENVLGRVLDVFQSRLTHLLGTAACKALSDSPALAWQMALEPAASQLSNPAAFFSTLKGFEGIDAWVASIQQAGYADGGETAEVDVFTHILQVAALSCMLYLMVSQKAQIC